MKLALPASAVFFTLCAAAAACSSSGTTAGSGGHAATSATSASGSASGDAGGAQPTSTGAGMGGELFDAGSGGGSQGGNAGYLIYAHSNTTLYTLDPLMPGLPLQKIGDFDCVLKPGEPPAPGKITSMTDVAIDENQKIWAVSSYAVRPITITGSAVHCEAPIQLNLGNDFSTHFYALSFAPQGVLDPNKEVLVAGNTRGELWSIAANGTLTQHGVFGTVPPKDPQGNAYPAANQGKPWELSGDIVFLANSGSPVGFATVRDCPSPPDTTGCSDTDTLIEIDLANLGKAGPTTSVTKSIRGQLLKSKGCGDTTATSYGYMYGIASWNDVVYGFSHVGQLVQIDLKDGSTCLVKGYPDGFSGAGVTTLAPIIPPPN
jgi:hypothetical protein